MYINTRTHTHRWCIHYLTRLVCVSSIFQHLVNWRGDTSTSWIRADIASFLLTNPRHYNIEKCVIIRYFTLIILPIVLLLLQVFFNLEILFYCWQTKKLISNYCSCNTQYFTLSLFTVKMSESYNMRHNMILVKTYSYINWNQNE